MLSLYLLQLSARFDERLKCLLFDQRWTALFFMRRRRRNLFPLGMFSFRFVSLVGIHGRNAAKSEASVSFHSPRTRPGFNLRIGALPLRIPCFVRSILPSGCTSWLLAWLADRPTDWLTRGLEETATTETSRPRTSEPVVARKEALHQYVCVSVSQRNTSGLPAGCLRNPTWTPSGCRA